MDPDHHQKPPPPYEEVQSDVQQTSSKVSPSSSKMNLSFLTDQNHLSIENPMAEVFAKPEFDHLELQIQGQINPNTNANSNGSSSSSKSSSPSSSGTKKLFQMPSGSMLNICREKSRQVFFQWKDWHRPEVIGIRLVLILLALVLMVQLVRVVKPSFTSNNNHRMLASSSKQELKMNSGSRTGKALANLLIDDDDQQHSRHASSDEHSDIKLFTIKLNQPDQDIDLEQNSNPDGHSTTKNNINHSTENENERNSEQDILEHDDPKSKIIHSDSNPTTKDEKTTLKITQTTPLSTTTATTTMKTSKTTVKTPTIITTTTTTTTTMRTPISSNSNNRNRFTSPPTILSNINNQVKNNKILDTISTTTSTTTITPSNSSSNKTYNISIIIHSANVPDMDSGYLLGRASDTYCNVFIDDQLVGKTPIIDNSNNPSWHYLLPRQFPVKANTWIRIELMDSDHVKNDHIGGILLNFGDLLKNGSLNKPINMFHGRGYIWVTISSAQNS